jgi:hypothetical protein
MTLSVRSGALSGNGSMSGDFDRSATVNRGSFCMMTMRH